MFFPFILNTFVFFDILVAGGSIVTINYFMFQVYRFVMQHLYILQNDHYHKSRYHSSPQS